MSLWEKCFPDDSGFNEYFFSNIYKPEYNLLLLKDNFLCSMAQMLPYEMINKQNIESVTYIYGACTHPDYRRQHLMDRLLKKSFEIDKQNNKFATILIPQEKWLFDFYKPFGYKPMLNIKKISHSNYLAFNKELFIKEVNLNDIDKMNEFYNKHISNGLFIKRDYNEWEKQINMFKNCGGHVLNIYDKEILVCYTFVWLYKDHFWCQEIVFEKGYENDCIANLQNKFKNPNCIISGFQFGQSEQLGCIYKYDLKDISSGYINLMLN